MPDMIVLKLAIRLRSLKKRVLESFSAVNPFLVVDHQHLLQ